MPRKRGTGTPSTTLTAEQRRELVERPMPAVNVLQTGRSWGGTSTVNWFQEGKGRAYTFSPTTDGGIATWLKTLNENGN